MTALNPRRDDVDAPPGRGFGRLSERHGRIAGVIGRRLLQIPIVLFVVSVLTFWLIQVVPGDPGRETLGQYATPAQVARWDVRNGLTGSIVARYLHWLKGFVTGNWGTSFVYSEPNRGLVMGHLLNSALLGVLAFLLMVPISIALGAVQAYREGRRTDRTITISLMTLSAIPPFVIGIVLLLIFAVVVHWVPVQASQDATGNGIQRLHAMIVPAVVLALSYLAVLTRMVRTGMGGAITSQYHRTAVLKGLDPRTIVRRHVLRNAIVPTLSLLGLYLGTLLCGDAVVETLFNYPGLGALLVTAAEHKDVVLLSDGVVVTGAVVLLALLAADVGLILTDPRIRFDNKES
jgi:peptide/nickel transport system permease protein